MRINGHSITTEPYTYSLHHNGMNDMGDIVHNVPVRSDVRGERNLMMMIG